MCARFGVGENSRWQIFLVRYDPRWTSAKRKTVWVRWSKERERGGSEIIPWEGIGERVRAENDLWICKLRGDVHTIYDVLLEFQLGQERGKGLSRQNHRGPTVKIARIPDCLKHGKYSSGQLRIYRLRQP